MYHSSVICSKLSSARASKRPGRPVRLHQRRLGSTSPFELMYMQAILTEYMQAILTGFLIKSLTIRQSMKVEGMQ